MLSLSRSQVVRTLNFFERFMEDETVHPSSRRTRNARTDGQTSRLFVERVETKDTTKTADDIEAQIKARLGLA
jgi:hypothetical protein